MSKPVLAVHRNCLLFDTPEFEQWVTQAGEHFQIVLYESEPVENVFLSIDARSIQFRGDWSVWWLSPEKLLNFKSYIEGQEPCKEAENGDKTNNNYTRG